MIEDPIVLYKIVLVSGAFFMLFGVILGLVAANMFGKKGQRQAPGDEKNEHLGLIEVARVWREPGSGKLIVEMDKKNYRSRTELSENLKDRLAKLVRDLREWFGVADLETAQPVVSPRLAAEAPLEPGIAKLLADVTLAKKAEQTSSVKPVSMNMVDIVSQVIVGGSPKRDSTPAALKSIAGQIDEILQKKLEDSPLRNRGIRLVDIPGGGLEVVVGLDRYEGVADVKDPEIRALIQACVAEWEQKNYPT